MIHTDHELLALAFFILIIEVATKRMLIEICIHFIRGYPILAAPQKLGKEDSEPTFAALAQTSQNPPFLNASK
mgnify:CR=1 FL=1